MKERDGDPLLLAHRGLGQTFSMEGITGETCTAERIHTPEHPYLENTIPSMKAAFLNGADIVELDIKPTKDGQFAVFHDWTLECRTNAEGTTNEYTMAELKRLDIGYGYTADNGKTFPFRGKGIGLMPSLDEVLTHFPDQSLLIHIKSDDPEEGKQLAQVLARSARKPFKTIDGIWRRSADCFVERRTSRASRHVKGYAKKLPASLYRDWLDRLYPSLMRENPIAYS